VHVETGPDVPSKSTHRWLAASFRSLSRCRVINPTESHYVCPFFLTHSWSDPALNPGLSGCIQYCSYRWIALGTKYISIADTTWYNQHSHTWTIYNHLQLQVAESYPAILPLRIQGPWWLENHGADPVRSRGCTENVALLGWAQQESRVRWEPRPLPLLVADGKQHEKTMKNDEKEGLNIKESIYWPFFSAHLTLHFLIWHSIPT
jgi:hypothetical protein